MGRLGIVCVFSPFFLCGGGGDKRYHTAKAEVTNRNGHPGLTRISGLLYICLSFVHGAAVALQTSACLPTSTPLKRNKPVVVYPPPNKTNKRPPPPPPAKKNTYQGRHPRLGDFSFSRLPILMGLPYGFPRSSQWLQPQFLDGLPYSLGFPMVPMIATMSSQNM